MICLECNTENPYGTAACSHCALDFSPVPPHHYSNHICQMQIAIREYLDQAIPREQFLMNCANFIAIVDAFEDAWSPTASTLSSRLADPLKEHFLAPLKEIDRGLANLFAVTELLRDFQEDGADSLLVTADEKLVDSFRLLCAGSAGVLHEVEMEELRQLKLGNTHDYSA